MNIKSLQRCNWPREMCIAHLQLQGWSPVLTSAKGRGLIAGACHGEHGHFMYQWAGAIVTAFGHSEKDGVTIHLSTWADISDEDLRKMIEAIGV